MIDILAFAAHPDDAELSCSGTLLVHASLGYKTAIVDLTEGQLGTRGTIESRKEESKRATEILGLSHRENLGLEDGWFEPNHETLLKVIEVIRRLKPKIVLANALEDRHPDHGRGGDLIERAWFLAGLVKVETQDASGHLQDAYRPNTLYRYMQDRFYKPDLIVDISSVWEQKKAAILAYESQFYKSGSGGTETYISSPRYLAYIEARARECGHFLNVEFGEGFTRHQPLGVRNLFDVI